MNTLVFDIETIPDTKAGRRLYNLAALSDQEVTEAMLQQRRQEKGTDFLPHYLHQIVAISVVLKTPEQFKVWSLGSEASSEAELIQRFFDGLEQLSPTLVSWNGAGFDLPVLHYRALLHGIACARYWETGDQDSTFRWNNYLNRFHARHTDLMDVLSAYQARAVAPLDDIAVLLGLPGKMGMDGSQVSHHYYQGNISDIRNYCETDVLNTYLVYLRFQLIRELLTPESYAAESKKVTQYLERSEKVHLQNFLKSLDPLCQGQ